MKTRKSLPNKTRAKLTAKADKGLVDLIYGDQSGFNLSAKVVYAWQKRGERIASSGLERQVAKCLGFYVASVSAV